MGPPMSLEILSGFAFSVALAFLVAILLELLEISHFGLWETFPARIKPLMLFVLLVLIVLGVALIFWMGFARWHAMQVNDEEVQKMIRISDDKVFENAKLEEEIRSLATSSNEESKNVKKVMIGLPLFIDFVAALAFSGAILGLHILSICML